MKITRDNKYIVFYSPDMGKFFSRKKDALAFAKEVKGIAYRFFVEGDNGKYETIANYEEG